MIEIDKIAHYERSVRMRQKLENGSFCVIFSTKMACHTPEIIVLQYPAYSGPYLVKKINFLEFF